MYKKVPFTNDYEISIDGNIRRLDGKQCNFTSIGDIPAVTLVIYGIEKTLSIEWLRLMSHFEVNIGRAYFFSVYFRPVKEGKYSNSVNQTMCFRGIHPEYKFGFRIIPNFTRYAISKEGEIWDTYLNERVITNESEYLRVHGYDPDKGERRNLMLHRLVALAWVKNTNTRENCVVNHLDGNKHNPYYTNLEWCTQKRNTDHKFETGLSKQNIECKVRNIETNEVTEFISLSSACRYMGIQPKASFNFERFNNRPINGKYELKAAEDETPWNYDYILTDKMARTKITVTYPNDEVIIVYGFKALKVLLNIPEELSFAEVNAISYGKLNNLKFTFELIDVNKGITRPIQVLDVASRKITNYDSMSAAERALNVQISSISYSINKGETYVIKGKAYRYKTDKKWNTKFSEADNAAKCILGIIKNGSTQEFGSIREAEKKTGIKRSTIARNLKGSTITSDWCFKYKV